VSSIEVYCELVKDLLQESGNAAIELATDIRGKLILKNQTWRKLNKVDEFLELIKLSSSKRVFGKNDYHEHSSRSHHIFQVLIKGKDKAL
jgi:hypothetical protein